MKKLMMVVLLMFGFYQVLAQNIKRPETYNYLRGHEAIQEQKYEDALDYFNKDIQENPKNGYSFVWIASLRTRTEEYGRALTAADLAIKYLPKKDVDYTSFAHTTRGDVYLHLGDTIKALSDYTEAIRLKPNETQPYEDRAQVYYEQGDYARSNADYRKMIELKPGDVMGYMGIGRNANAQEQWEEAIKQFDYVVKLDNNYSSAYSFRADSYIGLKKYSETIDDIITALTIDGNQKAYYLLQSIVDDAFPVLKTKLEIQCTKSPNDPAWPYYIGVAYEQKGVTKKAIEYYKKAAEINANSVLFRRIAVCYENIGEYDLALTYLEKTLQMDPKDVRAEATKADVYYESGRVDDAIRVMDDIVNSYPEWDYAYHRRAWFKENGGDTDGAIDDYTKAVILDPEDAYSYFCRGKMYEKKGEYNLAKEDFLKAIELDIEPSDHSVAQFAYFHLGEKEKAIDFMNKIIDVSNDSYYDAACLYSLMNEKETALNYLRMAFSHGYRRFAHIAIDRDLDNIRNLPEFKSMVNEYKEKHQRELKEFEDDSAEIKQSENTEATEVPFTKEGGVCKVKCTINDLPLHFVFDTGASDVTLSMVEATFMMKNDYLSDKDVIGSQHYMDANGEVSVGTIINLRKVNFGGLELKNVRASVVRNQKAPLLLGQSVLGRLGRIEIDNGRNVLKITKSTNSY